jgi:hypothetical protein
MGNFSALSASSATCEDLPSMANAADKKRPDALARMPALNADLLEASRKGLAAKVAAALKKGADPDASSSRQETPLMLAAADRHEACFDLLLPVSNALALNKDGDSALDVCAARGFVHGLRALLPLSDPKRQNNRGLTALMQAAVGRHGEAIDLLAPVSDLRATCRDGKTAFIWGAPRIFEPLLAGAAPWELTEALCEAAAWDNEASIHRLLALGADPWARSLQGHDAFECAQDAGAGVKDGDKIVKKLRTLLREGVARRERDALAAAVDGSRTDPARPGRGPLSL